MAGVNGDRKGKKDDNGIGTAIDFMLSNAKLVLGVGGAAMLGIATLAVKRVSERRFFVSFSPYPSALMYDTVTEASIPMYMMFADV